jgi:hypothetical protein
MSFSVVILPLLGMLIQCYLLSRQIVDIVILLLLLLLLCCSSVTATFSNQVIYVLSGIGFLPQYFFYIVLLHICFVSLVFCLVYLYCFVFYLCFVLALLLALVLLSLQVIKYPLN